MAPHYAPHMRAREKSRKGVDRFGSLAISRTNRATTSQPSRVEGPKHPERHHLEQFHTPQILHLQRRQLRSATCLSEVRSRAAGLWEVAKTDANAKDEISADTTKDQRASHIIRNFVHWAFIERWHITRLNPSFQVMEKLEMGCRAFRLMDLPTELRDNIYEYIGDQLVAEEGKEICLSKYKPPPEWRRESRYCHEPLSTTSESRTLQKLTSVCREFRDTFTEMYFGRNKFEISDRYPSGCLTLVEDVIQDIGMRQLIYVRELRVIFRWHKEETDHFRVSFDKKLGLKCLHQGYTNEQWTELADVVESAAVQKISEDSTGVFEIFLYNQDTLRRAVWGTVDENDDDSSEAYGDLGHNDTSQIQYGDPASPW